MGPEGADGAPGPEVWELLSEWTEDCDSCPVMMTPSCWAMASAKTALSEKASLLVLSCPEITEVSDCMAADCTEFSVWMMPEVSVFTPPD